MVQVARIKEVVHFTILKYVRNIWITDGIGHTVVHPGNYVDYSTKKTVKTKKEIRFVETNYVNLGTH